MRHKGQLLEAALDQATSNIMVAGPDYEICYINPALQKLFRNAEPDLRELLPKFQADDVVGKNIDVFHVRPEHQRAILDGLTRPYTAPIRVGPRHLIVTASPIFGPGGERLGTVTEWQDRTDEVHCEEDVQRVVDAAARGDLRDRVVLEGKQGIFLALGERVNMLLDTLSGIVKRSVTARASWFGWWENSGVGRTPSRVKPRPKQQG